MNNTEIGWSPYEREQIINCRIVENKVVNIIQEIPLVFTSNKTSFKVFLDEKIDIKNCTAKIALRMISSTNSIPNIDSKNNKFRYKKGSDNDNDWRLAELETGCYEINEIQKSIEYLVNKHNDQNNNIELNQKYYNIQIEVNEGLGKSIIKIPNDFSIDSSIGQVLVFHGIRFGEGINQSPEIIKINPVQCILVFCNLVDGSYLNNKYCQNLYAFYPDVPLGISFVEKPNPIQYLDIPRHKEEIQEINIWLTDQNENPLNLNNEDITLVLSLKISNS